MLPRRRIPILGDKASSEWEEEHQKSRADEIRSRVLLSTEKGAGKSTGGRTHSPPLFVVRTKGSNT